VISAAQLSAFGDLFWREAAGLSSDIAFPGASLQGEAGLWGLIPLRAMLSAGYDLAKGRAFVSLNLGRVF
jgi:hypothetical protein